VCDDNGVASFDRIRHRRHDGDTFLYAFEKPSACGGDARSEGGLGEMTRRKREIVGLRNERDFPYLVELALPPGGFRSVFLEIDAFHRERRIPVRRGRRKSFVTNRNFDKPAEFSSW
jgi:hypothetical protein